jgi:hypothetical protein
MQIRLGSLVVRSTVLLALFLPGCNSGPDVAEVTGVVTLADGKPLDLIHVEFLSENGPRSYGKTDDSGKFSLKLDDDSQQMGAIVGNHKVQLRDMWPSKDDVLGDGGDWVDNSKGKKSRIHSKYSDYTTSTLSFEVKAGEKNNFEINVVPAGRIGK